MSFALKSFDEKLHSTSIRLRLLEEGDVDNVCRWMSSSYILQHSFVVQSSKSLPDDFATHCYAMRYFDMLMSDCRRVTFAIIFDGEHIGNVGLKEICFIKKTAECFIEIGEKKFRGQGLGAMAMIKLLEYGFFSTGLVEIKLDVLEFNFPALKLYDQLGFVASGFNNWHYDEFGQYWRVLGMSIHKRNFRKKDNYRR